jgi:TRAP-type C4-dicarboxylate transport system permease large subunit
VGETLFPAGFVSGVIIGGCLMGVANGIARISLERLVKAIDPFLVVEIGVPFLSSYAPARGLWIPRLVGMSKQASCFPPDRLSGRWRKRNRLR